MTDEELERLLNAQAPRNFEENSEEIRGASEETGGDQEICDGGQHVEGGLTEEKPMTKAELIRGSVNHRCFVVPFNSTKWECGTVVAILNGRGDNPMYIYGVKLDDGRRVCKKVGSPLIRVLDEVVEEKRRVRNYRKRELTPEGALSGKEWSDADIADAIAEVADNVGHLCTFPETDEHGKVRMGARPVTGRITRIVVNRQQQKLQYRIEVQAGTRKRVYTKTCGPQLSISLTLDEEGARLNARYARLLIGKGRMTGSDALQNYKICEAVLDAAQRKFKKAGEELERARINYERAREVYIGTTL